MGNIRLCFGTFASLLNKFRPTDLQQQDFIAYLINGIDKNSRYISERSAVTRLLSCKIDYVLTTEATIKEPSHDKLQAYISKNVAPNIREDAEKMIILTLLDIIRKDKSLDQEHKELFKDYFGIYKEQLLHKSKFVFSDIISKALLYTTYGGVKNRFDKGVVPDINDEYITAATSAYLNDIEWDRETQTLTLNYIEDYYTFIGLIDEYEMHYFITSIDPVNGMDRSWFDKFTELREKASKGNYVVKDNSEMAKMISLYCDRLWCYMTFLISCMSTTDYCHPVVANLQDFRFQALNKRSELNRIYGEISRYAFPH